MAGGERCRRRDLVAAHVSSGLSTAVARQVVCHTDSAAPSGPAGKCDRGALGPSAPRVARASGADDYRQSRGNPFFLEELTRAVLDHADVAVPTPFRACSWRALIACRRPRSASCRRAVLGREVSPPCWRRSGTEHGHWNPYSSISRGRIPLCAPQCRGTHVCVQARLDPGGGL